MIGRRGTMGGRRTDPPWAATQNSDTTSRTVPSTPTLPAYLATTYTDATYGTKVVRISGDPGSSMTNVTGGTWGVCVQHHYSLDQAWNCDESLMYLETNHEQASAWASGSFIAGQLCTNTNNTYQCTTAGSSTAAPTGTGATINNGGTAVFKYVVTDTSTPTGRIFLDGQTYAPKSFSGNNGATYSIAERRWHPTNPALMFFTSADKFGTWNPSTNAQTLIKQFTGWSNLTFGSYKGFMSGDGNRIVIQGTNPSSVVAYFVYDIASDTMYPGTSGQSASTVDNSFVSRNGQYMLNTDFSDNLYVYNLSGTLLWTFTATSSEGNPTHFDLTTDPFTNDEVVVGRAHDFSGRIIKRSLSTGTETALTVSSPANYADHTSARGTKYPGWAAVSYPGWQSTSFPLYQGEITAVRLDGSKVCRICFHFSANSLSAGGTGVDYYSYPEASLSPSGTRIVFASLWCSQSSTMNGRPLYCFVADLR